MTDQRAKSLRWLANQFPAVETPRDDTDRMQTCIHLYCAAGADAIETLTAQLSALQSENAEKDKEISSREQASIDAHAETHYWRDKARAAEATLTRVKAERDAATHLLHNVWEMLDPDGSEGGYSEAATNMVAYLIYDKIRDFRHRRGAQGEG